MFSGVKLYALLGIGAFILVLMGSVAFLWQMHKADEANLGRKDDQIAAAKQEVKTLSNDLSDAAKENSDLRARMKLLDSLVGAERERQAQLEKDKQAISEQLDAIEKTVPKADQDCLDRPLPPAILELLRGTGAGGDDKDTKGADPGKPADSVPDTDVSG